MPAILPANASFFFTKAEMRYWLAYAEAAIWWSRLAQLYPIDTEFFLAGWIGMLSGLHEWKGPRVVEEPAPMTYLAQVIPFEDTKSIDVFKLRDDQFGLYAPIVTMMGRNAKKWPDYQLRDFLQAKNSYAAATGRQVGTDGLTHWNQAHPVDLYDASKGTYSNDYRGGFTSNGVVCGGALGVNAFLTVWEDMAARKQENGEAMGHVADLTHASTYMKGTLDTLLGAQFFGVPVVGNLSGMVGATENVSCRGLTDRLLNPDFTSDPNTWHMLVTNAGVKPFGFAVNIPPTFAYRISPTDPVVFDEHKYIYGDMARGTPIWGPPFLSSISGPS